MLNIFLLFFRYYQKPKKKTVRNKRNETGIYIVKIFVLNYYIIQSHKLRQTNFFLKIEKKPCTTDPQILLNNLDDVHLNELLCAVHGPE